MRGAIGWKMLGVNGELTSTENVNAIADVILRTMMISGCKGGRLIIALEGIGYFLRKLR